MSDIDLSQTSSTLLVKPSPPPQTNDAAVNDIQDLLINSVIMSYEGNWMLITQVEAYYHEKKIDDVAQNDSHFSFGKKLDIAFEKV